MHIETTGGPHKGIVLEWLDDGKNFREKLKDYKCVDCRVEEERTKPDNEKQLYM
jgi:hypothetical protein